MTSTDTITNFLNAEGGRVYLSTLYGDDPSTRSSQLERYLGLLDRFTGLYPGQREVSDRAIHFYRDDHRVVEQVAALEAGDFSEVLLQRRGAWRVHGGGFAGTIQAFMPDELMPEY